VIILYPKAVVYPRPKKPPLQKEFNDCVFHGCCSPNALLYNVLIASRSISVYPLGFWYDIELRRHPITDNPFESSTLERLNSQAYSICIAKDAEITIPKSIHFSFGEFGWECGSLGSISEKASYLYTGLVSNDRQHDADAIFQKLKDKGIEVTSEEAVIKTNSYVNSEGKTVEYTSGENTGYVDHSDELGSFLDAICEDDGKLLSYLFSDLSFIITGNDNDDEDVDINVSYAHDEYYKVN